MAAKFERLLCVRADNMGDIVMSGPAISALKRRFGCRITLLASPMGMPIVPYMPDVDDMIVHDFPWVRAKEYAPGNLEGLIRRLRRGRYDGAVIFTVYSQNPLPMALLLYMAGVPRRLAYCRENPYQLLTDWVPDKEPYSMIRHQVERDLLLVDHWGAAPAEKDRLRLELTEEIRERMRAKLAAMGVRRHAWVVVHPGVSEEKRRYPASRWAEICRMLQDRLGMTVILSGARS